MIGAHSMVRRIAILAVGAMLGACAAGTVRAPAASEPSARADLVIEHVNVVPMDRERVLDDQTVVIREGRIVAIAPARSTKPIAAGRTIDGRGKYLIPGLADMHVHLSVGDLDRTDATLEAERLRRSAEYLRLFLAAGVTTVRDMAGTPLQLAVRREVDEGRIVAPRMILAGPVLETRFTMAGMESYARAVRSPEEGRLAVHETRDAGYDLVKVYNQIDAPIYQAIVEEARKLGLPVAGHVPFAVGLDGALAAGQRSIEHFRSFDFALDTRPQAGLPFRRYVGWLHTTDARMREVAERVAAAGTWNCPTLVTVSALRTDAQLATAMAPAVPPYVPGWMKPELDSTELLKFFTNEDREITQAALPGHLRMVKYLHDAGAPIVAGTDAPAVGNVPGTSLHEELALYVRAGLRPFEALRTATVGPATMMGWTDAGTVTVGARADLVLLDANPLADIAHVTKTLGVVVRGQWYDVAELKTVGTGYAFVDANVIDVESGRTIEGQTVVVRDGRIAEMGPTGTSRLGPDLIRVDGTGRFLMPGLADMHAHVTDADELDLYLANGVTLLRLMWGERNVLKMRDEISSRRLLGPRLVVGSRIVDGQPPIHFGSAVVADAGAVTGFVREARAAGFDFLKPYNNLSAASFGALMSAARAEGLPVAGHVPLAVSLEDAMRAGMRSVEHLTGLNAALARDRAQGSLDNVWAPGTLQQMGRLGKGELRFEDLFDDARLREVAKVAGESGTWYVPTLSVLNVLAPPKTLVTEREARPELRYVAPGVKSLWRTARGFYDSLLTPDQALGFQLMFDEQVRRVGVLHGLGVPMLLGTDAPNPYIYMGYAVAEELELLHRAGLTPVEALRTATSNAARFLGEEGRFGVVRVGATADLVLLEANPLDEVGNVRRIAGVMRDGTYLPQPVLQARLDRLAVRYRRLEQRFDGLPTGPRRANESELEAASFELRTDKGPIGAERFVVAGVDRKPARLWAQAYEDSDRANVVSVDVVLVAGSPSSFTFELAGNPTLVLARSGNHWTVRGSQIAMPRPRKGDTILTATSLDAFLLRDKLMRTSDAAPTRLRAWIADAGAGTLVERDIVIRRLPQETFRAHYGYAGAVPYELLASDGTRRVLWIGGGFNQGALLRFARGASGSDVVAERFL